LTRALGCVEWLPRQPHRLETTGASIVSDATFTDFLARCERELPSNANEVIVPVSDLPRQTREVFASHAPAVERVTVKMSSRNDRRFLILEPAGEGSVYMTFELG